MVMGTRQETTLGFYMEPVVKELHDATAQLPHFGPQTSLLLLSLPPANGYERDPRPGDGFSSESRNGEW